MADNDDSGAPSSSAPIPENDHGAAIYGDGGVHPVTKRTERRPRDIKSSAELRTQALEVLRDGDPVRNDLAEEIFDQLPALADNDVHRGLKELYKDGVGIRAVKLTLSGLTEAEVAKEMGVTPQSVRKYLRRVLTKTAAKIGIEDLRARELATYNLIQSQIWPMIFPENPDKPVSLAAIDRFEKISKARRELLGLDAPRQVHVEGEIKNTFAADAKAEDVVTFMDLADMLSEFGSGRAAKDEDVMDAEIIDDDDDIDGQTDAR